MLENEDYKRMQSKYIEAYNKEKGRLKINRYGVPERNFALEGKALIERAKEVESGQLNIKKLDKYVFSALVKDWRFSSALNRGNVDPCANSEMDYTSQNSISHHVSLVDGYSKSVRKSLNRIEKAENNPSKVTVANYSKLLEYPSYYEPNEERNIEFIQKKYTKLEGNSIQYIPDYLLDVLSLINHLKDACSKKNNFDYDGGITECKEPIMVESVGQFENNTIIDVIKEIYIEVIEEYYKDRKSNFFIKSIAENLKEKNKKLVGKLRERIGHSRGEIEKLNGLKNEDKIKKELIKIRKELNKIRKELKNGIVSDDLKGVRIFISRIDLYEKKKKEHKLICAKYKYELKKYNEKSKIIADFNDVKVSVGLMSNLLYNSVLNIIENRNHRLSSTYLMLMECQSEHGIEMPYPVNDAELLMPGYIQFLEIDFSFTSRARSAYDLLLRYITVNKGSDSPHEKIERIKIELSMWSFFSSMLNYLLFLVEYNSVEPLDEAYKKKLLEKNEDIYTFLKSVYDRGTYNMPSKEKFPLPNYDKDIRDVFRSLRIEYALKIFLNDFKVSEYEPEIEIPF